ncbi:ATP-, maltotriose-and DNA-dependent transcriptional regulator MalT [Pseudomonas marincola]|nr:LuxR C-terminal-related transcriptional regulator [Pseudomonas marincola]SFU14924.1 ATP-, maltotriose-and DNA-dependent transcriptional regulator MalT [Pseudomonas marincola]
MHDNVRALPGSRVRALDVSLPRLPANHVARPRLVESLVGEDSRVTLICAPAGYGKSVLLNECVRQASMATRIVWLDLLGHTLTPEDLLARLAASLHLPVGEGDAATELSLLIGRLVQQPVWIILDDYPRQPCAELDACLDHLLERSPHTLRWWIAGRRRPEWHLPRLLLQGAIQERNAQALALSIDELSGYLQQLKAPLPGPLAAQLHQSTEGWLAGICLHLIEGNMSELGQRLEAGSALLLEYIQREVLDELSDELREVVLILAHIPRFSAALCQHMLEVHDGAQVIEQLRQHQLFLSQLDEQGEWYCLSPAFAKQLKLLPQCLPPLHQHILACQWFAQRGEVRDAVEHALCADQPETAASYLQRYGEDQLLIGQSVSQLLHWREELPASLFASTPHLIILQAWALIICTRLDEVEDCIDELARYMPQPSAKRQQLLLANYQVIMGVLHRQRGLASARQHCLEALSKLDERGWSQQVLCHQALTQQAGAEQNLTLAEEHCNQGLKLAREHRNILFDALLTIDQVHLLIMRGQRQVAKERTEYAVSLLKDGGMRGPVYARLLLLRGLLHAGRGERMLAREAFEAGIQEAETCEDAYSLHGHIGLAELCLQEGHFEAAQQHLRNAEQKMQAYRVPRMRYHEALSLAKGQLWLHLGDAEKALSVFTEVREHLQEHKFLAPSGFCNLLPMSRLLEARGRIATGQTAQALADLQQMMHEFTESGHLSLATQAQMHCAQALEQLGEPQRADQELSAALLEAQRQEHFRPVLELMQSQPQWLEDVLLLNSQLQPLRQHLISASEAVDTTLPSSVPVLSKREIAVLDLIAKGCSNQQIAEALFISLHTVKSHARRINTKLGVQRRTQAVALAKAEGLIG